MQLHPQFERFIDEQVKAGFFPTREAVVEDALLRMMDEEIALTDEDRQAIAESEQQIARGEYIEFDTFAAEMRKKYGIKS